MSARGRLNTRPPTAGPAVLNDLMPTVRLVPLPPAAMQALIDADPGAAGVVAGVTLPPAFVDVSWLWRIRVEQIANDPASAEWVARAVVDVATDVVVGHAGFHGPPDDAGLVEVAYTVLPEFRGRRYAVAALAELLRWAAAATEVRTVRASISPENAASLAVVRRFGFQPVGEQWDEEDGLELLFERPAGVVEQPAGVGDGATPSGPREV